MKQMIAATISAALLLGCSPGFHRENLRSTLRAQAAFDDSQLEAIEQLRPQARLPMRIAVSQPADGRPWGPDELEEIASWEEPLRAAGVARRVTILPESLIDCTGAACTIDAQRRAAARIGADTLLVMNPATEVDAYVNAMVPLDATIIGLWVVPAHHRDALTLVEATLIDNRNRYVYAFARGDGEAGTVRPFAFAHQPDVSGRSRLAALRDLRPNLLREAAALR